MAHRPEGEKTKLYEVNHKSQTWSTAVSCMQIQDAVGFWILNEFTLKSAEVAVSLIKKFDQLLNLWIHLHK